MGCCRSWCSSAPNTQDLAIHDNMWLYVPTTHNHLLTTHLLPLHCPPLSPRQVLAVEAELGLDRGRTNTCGGAIALGHPLGASGARITAHLAHRLAASPTAKLAIGSACIGGGQG